VAEEAKTELDRNTKKMDDLKKKAAEKPKDPDMEAL
jgi:hypothetical protein